MPNKFTGKLTDTNGRYIDGATVILTVSKQNISKQTKTDKNGKWTIDLEKEVSEKDIEILFTKSGLESKKIKGPAPTAKIEGYIDPLLGGSLKLQKLFESGKYLVTSLGGDNKAVLDQELEDLFQFSKSNPKNIKIKIKSSESQVPNNDNEGGNKDFKIVGSLARERGLTLRNYIEESLTEKINKDSTLKNKEDYKPLFDYTEQDISLVGDEKWDGKDANADKYKKDQFVEVIVELIEKPKDCVSNLIIDIAYIGEGHCCNSTTFELYGNGVLLTRNDGKGYISLNNREIKDLDKWRDIYDRQAKLGPNSQITSNYDLNPKLNPTSITANVQNAAFFLKQNSLDNCTSKYNIPSTDGKYTTGFRGDTTETMFQDYIEGEQMNLFNVEKPPVLLNGGWRYNRIIINTQTNKQVKNGDSPIIKLTMKCINPANSREWDGGCHKGTASIRIYRLDYKNVVMWRIPFKEFNSPTGKNQTIELFDFNTCNGDITNENKSAFTNLISNNTQDSQ